MKHTLAFLLLVGTASVLFMAWVADALGPTGRLQLIGIIIALVWSAYREREK